MVKIGLTVSYSEHPDDETDQWRIDSYVNAIQAGGAQPTVLYLDEWEARSDAIVNEFDGLVLAGGADLPTEWYGQEPLEGAGLELVSERRPNFEKIVVASFWAAHKPVLGICYGCQFINVWRGGALWQDLRLQTGTPTEHRNGSIHKVRIDRNSQLFQITGEEIFDVPSYHHQAISTPAPDASIVGWAVGDGTIEAMEWRSHPFFLGVQWHPERSPEANATRRLFTSLRMACAAR